MYNDGHFKLTVFSDLHYGEAEDLSWGPEQDRNSDNVMRSILQIDPPDYVVINGDLITGESKELLLVSPPSSVAIYLTNPILISKIRSTKIQPCT